VRRTDRRPFIDSPVDTPSLHALRRAALDEAAWLHIVTDPTQLAAVRAIADRARREQDADPAFRAEVAARISASPDRRSDVPAGTNGMPGGDVETEPVIAVLSSHLSGPSAEIQVGLIGGTRPPQAVLRIGHARPPRRRVDELLVPDLAVGSPC